MKRETKFNPELAASVLIDAAYTNDLKASTKWKVAERSLWNWRQRLATDPAFARIFLQKKKQFDAAWVDRLSIPIQKAMDFIGEVCENCDSRQKSNPEMVNAVANALKVMSDVSLTGKALDAGTPLEDPTPAGVPEEIFGQPPTSDLTQ